MGCLPQVVGAQALLVLEVAAEELSSAQSDHASCAQNELFLEAFRPVFLHSLSSVSSGNDLARPVKVLVGSEGVDYQRQIHLGSVDLGVADSCFHEVARGRLDTQGHMSEYGPEESTGERGRHSRRVVAEEGSCLVVVVEEQHMRGQD